MEQLSQGCFVVCISQSSCPAKYKAVQSILFEGVPLPQCLTSPRRHLGATFAPKSNSITGHLPIQELGMGCPIAAVCLVNRTNDTNSQCPFGVLYIFIMIPLRGCSQITSSPRGGVRGTRKTGSRRKRRHLLLCRV